MFACEGGVTWDVHAGLCPSWVPCVQHSGGKRKRYRNLTVEVFGLSLLWTLCNDTDCCWQLYESWLETSTPCRTWVTWQHLGVVTTTLISSNLNFFQGESVGSSSSGHVTANWSWIFSLGYTCWPHCCGRGKALTQSLSESCTSYMALADNLMEQLVYSSGSETFPYSIIHWLTKNHVRCPRWSFSLCVQKHNMGRAVVCYMNYVKCTTPIYVHKEDLLEQI